MAHDRRPNFAGLLLALAICAVASAPVRAQTHKVAKSEDVVRAVGVYEWTGDMAKPNASRLIPITLFIDGKLQDAGVYLARPVPLALLTGNIYEIDQAGVPKGTVDLLYAKHLVATDTATTTYDDGWFGYGQFSPPAIPKKPVALKPSKTLAVINGMDADSGKPHFSSKSASPGTGDAAKPAADPDSSANTPAGDPERPTMKRHSDTSDPAATSSSSATPDTPTADPDRPTMKRHPDTTASSTPNTDTPAADPDRPTMKRAPDQTASTGSGSSGSGSDRDTPADDADRPTLRRRSPQDAAAAKGKTPQASVTEVGPLNDDPNRPMLHHGKAAGVPTEVDFPKLSGLPGDKDLQQLVAVSDAANRPVHDFSRAWDDEAEHQAVLAKMQAAARLQLTAYEAVNSPPPPVAAPKPDARHPNSKLRRGVTPDTNITPPEALVDEQLKGYLLSYGGAPTYVYTAHTDGLGPTLRFVTVVAQVNMQGEPEIALKSVTDAAHLDRIPRMRLVDVVDAEASNRASLLFELRGQNSRQFGLYRVIGARADQTFLTGTTQ